MAVRLCVSKAEPGESVRCGEGDGVGLTVLDKEPESPAVKVSVAEAVASREALHERAKLGVAEGVWLGGEGVSEIVGDGARAGVDDASALWDRVAVLDNVRVAVGKGARDAVCARVADAVARPPTDRVAVAKVVAMRTGVAVPVCVGRCDTVGLGLAVRPRETMGVPDGGLHVALPEVVNMGVHVGATEGRSEAERLWDTVMFGVVAGMPIDTEYDRVEAQLTVSPGVLTVAGCAV